MFEKEELQGFPGSQGRALGGASRRDWWMVAAAVIRRRSTPVLPRQLELAPREEAAPIQGHDLPEAPATVRA